MPTAASGRRAVSNERTAFVTRSYTSSGLVLRKCTVPVSKDPQRNEYRRRRRRVLHLGYLCISQALWKSVSAASRVSASPEFGARAPISVQYHNSLSVLCMRYMRPTLWPSWITLYSSGRLSPARRRMSVLICPNVLLPSCQGRTARARAPGFFTVSQLFDRPPT